MKLYETTPAQEIRGEAIRLYQIRVVICAVIAVVYGFTAFLGGFTVNYIPLIFCLAAEIFINCPYPFYFRSSREAYQFIGTSIMCDFMVETLVIHFIGGIDAMFFSAIYLISIVYCALKMPSRFTFVMATLASLLYSGLIIGEFRGWIPHHSTLGLDLSLGQQIVLVLSHIAFFYLVGIFAWYISEALESKEKEMTALVRELHDAYKKVRFETQSKAEFMTRMTHELRSPLNTIIGLARIIREPEITPHEQKKTGEYAEKISKSGEHLLELINDVLDISKIEANRMKINYGEVDMTELVRSTLDLFYEEACFKQIKLRFMNVIDTGFKLRADARKVRQILYNLLSNAIKYTFPGGEVTVKLEKTQDAVILNVKDNGIGISAENLKSLFQPYQRFESKSTGEISGTGLGLAITKELVELHQGTITVESTPGAGSLFAVALPKVPPPPPAKTGVSGRNESASQK